MAVTIDGSTGWTYADNIKHKYGTGEDLEIYHNGTNSLIQNGTGELLIRAKTSENSINCNPDAGTEIFYDNSKKLETTSTGATVTGKLGIGTTSPERTLHLSSNNTVFALTDTAASTDEKTKYILSDAGILAFGKLNDAYDTAVEHLRITNDGKLRVPDNGKFTAGASDDLQIYHDGTNSYILDNGAGHLNIKTNGTDISFTKTPHEQLAKFITDGACELYYDNVKKLETGPGGTAFTGESAWGNAGSTDPWSATGDVANGTLINHWGGGSTPFAFSANVNNHIVAIMNRVNGNGVILEFKYNGSVVGSISSNANSLPSDRNFKTNISDLNLGLSLVNKLKPSQFNYKIDDANTPVMYGLIAQELEETLTSEGVTKNSTQLIQHHPTDDTESDYDVDYSKLIPILINSIKELSAEVETLKTKVAALEAG